VIPLTPTEPFFGLARGPESATVMEAGIADFLAEFALGSANVVEAYAHPTLYTVADALCLLGCGPQRCPSACGRSLLSDALNHNSMIEGVRQSGCEKRIWRHNDVDHLEQALKPRP